MAKLTAEQEIARDEARAAAKRKLLDAETALPALERSFKATVANAKAGKETENAIVASGLSYTKALEAINAATKEVARLKKPDALAAVPITLKSHDKE